MAEPQPFLFVVPNPVFVSQCPILCMIAEKKQNQQTPKCLCLCSQPPVGQGFGYKRHWIKSSQWNGAKPWVGRGEGRDRDLVRCPQHHGALTGGSLAGDLLHNHPQGTRECFCHSCLALRASVFLLGWDTGAFSAQLPVPLHLSGAGSSPPSPSKTGLQAGRSRNKTCCQPCRPQGRRAGAQL